MSSASATVVEGLKDASQKLSTAVAKFEKEQKAAIDIITPYMKKSVDTAAVDANKKIEDFKVAAKAFRDAGVAMATATKEISAKVGVHAKEVEDLPAAAVIAPSSVTVASAGVSPMATPRGSEPPSTPRGGSGAAAAATSDSNERIAELEKKEIALTAAHQAELSKIKSQCDSMTFAYNQLVDKSQAAEEALQRQVAELTEAAKARDEHVKTLEAKGAASRKQEEKLVAESKALAREKAELIQRLGYADRSRDNEYMAFEHATREHEREIHQWQTKHADALALTERMRLEKQALEARVADDHLREHIRALQRENNALREERINALHGASKEPVALSQLTQVLQENIAALEREVKFLNDRNKQLQLDLGEREKTVADALQSVMEERRKSQIAADNYLRKIRVLEFDQSMAAVHMKSASHQSSVAATAAQKELSRQLTTSMAASDDVDEHRSSSTVLTWDKGSQVDDVGRRDLEREVLMLRATVADLEELRGREDEERQRSCATLEENMMQLMRTSEAQIADLQKEVKIRSFKLSKANGSVEVLKQQLSQAQTALAAVRAAPPPTDESKLRSLERQLASAQIENADLISRNKSLKREMQMRQEEADEQFRRRCEAPPPAENANSSPRSAGSTSPSKRSTLEALAGGDVPTAAGDAAAPMTDGYTAARRQYLAELEAIDHGLLELHQKSIALDTQDAAAIEEFESSQKALQERLSYLETSAVFWRSAKSSGHLGPNGESRATMAEMCQKELAAKQSEFQHATDAMQKSFLVTTQKREQILRLTTSLMKKRAELDWPPKSNKAES